MKGSIRILKLRKKIKNDKVNMAEETYRIFNEFTDEKSLALLSILNS